MLPLTKVRGFAPTVAMVPRLTLLPARAGVHGRAHVCEEYGAGTSSTCPPSGTILSRSISNLIEGRGVALVLPTPALHPQPLLQRHVPQGPQRPVPRAQARDLFWGRVDPVAKRALKGKIR
jgi:hypothetical protein